MNSNDIYRNMVKLKFYLKPRRLKANIKFEVACLLYEDTRQKTSFVYEYLNKNLLFCCCCCCLNQQKCSSLNSKHGWS